MKRLVAFFIMAFGATVFVFSLGSWYGRMSADLEQRPTQTVYKSSSRNEVYMEYVLEHCVLKVKELQSK